MDAVQNGRLDFLVKTLWEEIPGHKERAIFENYHEKRRAFRKFMNIRMPGRISEEFLEIQDAFLKEEAKEKGIVPITEILTVKEQFGSGTAFADKLSVWQGDITRLRADAIVNAANPQMLGCFIPCHGCIDNVIHSSAGVQLREECHEIMSRKRMQYGNAYQEPTGTAVITGGYNLPAAHVIHTVGPVVSGGLTDSLRQDLRNCYRSILQCALEKELKSIAFCCISTGEFHFPNGEAAAIAVDTVQEFLGEHGNEIERIIFNVFKDVDRELYYELLS